MKILGIDTGCATAAAAITDNTSLLADFTLESGNTHSTTLLPMIEASLKALNLSINNIDLIGFAAGPGSFTGVRIGAATVKGLAFASSVPCIGVSSLEAMAENLKGLSGIVCSAINARRGQTYCAVFDFTDGKSERLLGDTALAAGELCEILEKYSDKPLYLTGDGAPLIRELYKADNLKETPRLLERPDGFGVAALAFEKWISLTEEEKTLYTGDSLTPIYLKKPQAERELEEKNRQKREGAKQ